MHARDCSPILYPALAYSNILFFKSAYNVQIIVIENEPEDRLVDRFRKEVIQAGVFQECRRRRFFENQREKRKRKSREAAKKNRRRCHDQELQYKREMKPLRRKSLMMKKMITGNFQSGKDDPPNSDRTYDFFLFVLASA
ncbi:hypothetical protein K1719_030429 [Acacia pycnantha]|nr:hypothetical protein K1719_030429 [Acacia pycnantha]